MSISSISSSPRYQGAVSQQSLSPELESLVVKAKAAAQVSTSLPVFIKQLERKVTNAGQDTAAQLANLVYAAMADQTKTDFSPAITAFMRQLPDKETFDAAKKQLLKYVGTEGNQAKFAKNGTLEPLAQLLTQLEYEAPAVKVVEEEPVAESHEEPVNEPVIELEDAPQQAASGCSRKWLVAIPVMAAAATGFYFLHKWHAEQSSCGEQNPFDQTTLWDTASTFAHTTADALRTTVADWMTVPSYNASRPSLFQTDIPNSTPIADVFGSAAQTVQQWTPPVVARNVSQPLCYAADFVADQAASASEAVVATVKTAVQTVQQWTPPVVERSFSQPVCSMADASLETLKANVPALPAPGDALQKTAEKAQEVIDVTIANLKPVAKRITFPTRFASQMRVVANQYCMAVARVCIPICNQAGQLIKPVMNHLGQFVPPKAPWVSCQAIKL